MTLRSGTGPGAESHRANATEVNPVGRPQAVRRPPRPWPRRPRRGSCPLPPAGPDRPTAAPAGVIHRPDRASAEQPQGRSPPPFLQPTPAIGSRRLAYPPAPRQERRSAVPPGRAASPRFVQHDPRELPGSRSTASRAPGHTSRSGPPAPEPRARPDPHHPTGARSPIAGSGSPAIGVPDTARSARSQPLAAPSYAARRQGPPENPPHSSPAG